MVFKNKKINIIIVRPAVVFGEFNFGNVYNLINQIKSGYFAIIGNGKNIKSVAYAGNLVDSVLFSLFKVNRRLFVYNYCDYPQNNIESQVKLIGSLLGKNFFKIPLFITKFITIPIDILEYIFNIDLKINSMRVNKFTTSTYFKSDKIREIGFKPTYSLNNCFKVTLDWILKKQYYSFKKKWFKIASKL